MLFLEEVMTMAGELAKMQRAATREELLRMALVVALDRLGGSLDLTNEAYTAAAAKYGGASELGIELEPSATGPSGPHTRFTLVRKAPTLPPAPGSRIV